MKAVTTSCLSVLTVAIISSTQAYHVTAPTASIGRGRSSQSLVSLKISSSSFFGIGATRRSILTPSNSLQLSSIPNGENTVDSDVQAAGIESSTSDDATSSSGSFLQTIDNLGMKLKPWALAAHDKSQQIRSRRIGNGINGNSGQTGQGSMVRSILYSIQSNILWMMYIFYRGYRGFFLILPAVFREVYRQLEESNVIVDAFDDESKQVSSSVEQQPMRLRTRITVSVLSGILTLSYVVSGLLRVFGEFCWMFLVWLQ
jgi:hypothetical protein